MKKFILIFLILVAVFVGVKKFWPATGNQVCFETNCFEVELAETSEELSRGLMFREELAENKGMLFVFPEERMAPFWMKNTLIPLDIIWINQNREIVFINKDSQPCPPEWCVPINPGVAAKYVLEVNAGIAEKIGLLVGAKMLFDL
ncbi:MAG: DUF192 domain-containing protein [bacterium]